MSVRQDRLTFFGVLAAVIIVVLGYLQLGQLYPVAGRQTPAAASASDRPAEPRQATPVDEESDTRPDPAAIEGDAAN